MDSRALVLGLEATSPELRALDRRAAAARAGIEVAKKGFYPDFVIGAEYTFLGTTSLPGAPDPGEDALGLRMGLSLPFWSGRPGARLRESQAREIASRASLREAANRLSSDLELALYRMRDGDRRVDLYRNTLLPKAEESLAAALAAYETGSASFLDYLDSERVLLEFLLAAARADSDRAQALATVERITGAVVHQEP
jgi:outer membrane protein TolC